MHLELSNQDRSCVANQISRAVAQDEFLDLARRGARQFSEDKAFGPFKTGKVLAAELFQRGGDCFDGHGFTFSTSLCL